MDGARADGAAVRLGVHFLAVLSEVGGKLADDFLQNILKSDQSHQVTVFVNHDTEPQLLQLELPQLRVQWCVFRYEIGRLQLPL